MDKQLVRDYREHYRLVSEVERQEQRAATSADRWQQLNALWNLAIGLGITRLAADDVDIVRRRWVPLKKQHERTGGPLPVGQTIGRCPTLADSLSGERRHLIKSLP